MALRVRAESTLPSVADDQKIGGVVTGVMSFNSATRQCCTDCFADIEPYQGVNLFIGFIMADPADVWGCNWGGSDENNPGAAGRGECLRIVIELKYH